MKEILKRNIEILSTLGGLLKDLLKSQARILIAVCLILLLCPSTVLSDPITDKPITPETYFSFGYGTSYGGFGICAEYMGVSQITGHAGIGYFPAKSITGEDFVKDKIFGGAGIRFYFSKQRQGRRFYFNAQFGTIGVAARYLEIYDSYSGYYYEEKQQLVLGPSALIGMKIVTNPEQKGNKFFLDIAFGLSVAINNPEWSPLPNTLPTLDLGLGLTF